MRSFWVDPYLWIHLAGIAAVPIFLEFCLVGLSLGEPFFPAWLELLLVGAIGILPILWMQWQRPFSIFSLLVLALKPTRLTEDQRRILSLFKSPLNRVLAVLVAVGMAWVLWQLYQLAPVVPPNLFPGIARGTALLIAALAFFGANLFLQIPISVLGVLWTSNSQFAATVPYPVEQIRQGFTIPGIRVDAIVPPLFSEPVKARVPASPAAPSTSQPPSPPAPPPLTTTTVPNEAPIAPVAEPSAADLDELEDEFEDEAERALEDEAASVADDGPIELANREGTVTEIGTSTVDAATAATTDVDTTAEIGSVAEDPILEAEILNETTDTANPVTEAPIEAAPQPVDSARPSTLLRESEPLRLTETVDGMEAVPIAESVVERLVSQEESTMLRADTEPESVMEQDLGETNGTLDEPDDVITASAEENLTEFGNPPSIDIIEDATMTETIEEEPGRDAADR